MAIAPIWEEFLTIAKEEVGSRVVETWFKAITLRRWDSLQKTIFLQAPNPFVKNWIKSNYISTIQLHLSRLLNVSELHVVFIDEQGHKPQEKKTEVARVTKIEPARPVVSSTRPIGSAVSPYKSRSSINQSYLFDTFVVGPNNSLAYAAAQAITEKPGALYNPLFIYGDSGLGKTHLLHAIGNEIKRKHPDSAILYQPADRFVTEFINAIRFDKVHRFKAKYHSIDVLLVDDIQFISNKDQTQEAFFHIFNSLYEAHKQIVFSSDTFPQHMQGIAERLRSRLGWGLVADIHMPPLETRIAILKRKAHASKEPLPDDVAHFIASRSLSNIRELEGALIRVLAFSNLTKQPITLEVAQRVLERSHKQEEKAPINLESVVRCVTKHYSYTLDQLRSKRRDKQVAQVRQLTMFLMKRLTTFSLRDIGSYLGGRDHSTVMHAYSKIKKMASHDTSFKQKLSMLENEIANGS